MSVTNEMKQWARAAAPDVPGDMVDHILQAAFSAGPGKCHCAPGCFKTDPGCPIHSPVGPTTAGFTAVGRGTAAAGVELCRQLVEQVLSAMPENYAGHSFGVTAPDGTELGDVIITVVKPGGKSPHELRREAEGFTAVDMGTAAADGYRSAWISAENPPDGEVGKWSRRVVAVTNVDNAFSVSYFHGEDGGVWQRPKAMADGEQFTKWSEIPV